MAVGDDLTNRRVPVGGNVATCLISSLSLTSSEILCELFHGGLDGLADATLMPMGLAPRR